MVLIAGFDGRTIPKMFDGMPHFSEYTTTADFPAKAVTIDFHVPSPPMEIPKRTTPAGKPSQ